MPSKKKKKKTEAGLCLPTKCATPNCNCCPNGTRAIYRADQSGNGVFTGLVCPAGGDIRTQTRRLNDALDDLEGPSRPVKPCEFLAVMSFYPSSDSTHRPVQLEGMLPRDIAAQFWEAGDAQPPERESEVRPGDRVQVACMQRLPDAEQFARERFWVEVHGVVPFPPTLIASATESLNWISAPGQSEPLDGNTLLKVPLEYALGVRAGWAW